MVRLLALMASLVLALAAQAEGPARQGAAWPALASSLHAASAPAARRDADEAQQPVSDPGELARSLQALLGSTGCYGGAIDGVWGPRSRAALADWARHAGRALPGTEPGPEIWELVASHHDDRPGRVCPLTCGPRHELRGNGCVLRTCPAGQTLTDRGSCVAATAQRTVPPRTTPPATAAPPAGGTNCFVFNGRQVCN